MSTENTENTDRRIDELAELILFYEGSVQPAKREGACPHVEVNAEDYQAICDKLRLIALARQSVVPEPDLLREAVEALKIALPYVEHFVVVYCAERRGSEADRREELEKLAHMKSVLAKYEEVSRG